MFDGLKLYEASTASGAVWLGDLPAHWHVRSGRAVFEEVRSTGHNHEELLSVTINRGVIRQTDLLSGTSKKDQSNLDRSAYKLVEPGDLAYNKMRAWQGAIGLSRYRGIVSPAYVVVRPRGVRGEYLHHLMRTPAFATEAERWSYGITSDQWSLRPDHFKMIYFSVPPMDEQDAIVKYLAHARRRIDRAIDAKRQLIALLEEQKQAVINHAVRNGLDESAERQHAQFPWISEIPSHWRAMRLKDVAQVQTGLTIGGRHVDQSMPEFPYLRVANVQMGTLDLSKITTIKMAPPEAAQYRLRPSDVLMTEGGDIDKLGRATLWSGEIDDCLHQNHVFAVRCRPMLDPRYLVFVLSAPIGRDYFHLTSKKTTNLASTNSSILRAFALPVPPREEQRAIVSFIESENASVDVAIDRARSEIELLEEFRIRLTADVVTGQVDVREVAARLPDIDPAEVHGDVIDVSDDDFSEEAADYLEDVTA